MTSLDQLRVGQRASIKGVAGADALVQRLLEMGLMEGAHVEVLGFAPFGDPMEVRLRDYRLSLRRREAARVSVVLQEEEPGLTVEPTESDIEEPCGPCTGRNGHAVRPGTLTVALVGNPNTGKTTLFNALAGMRQRVGNYPGVTVEIKKGQTSWHGRTFDLVDLPGTYSLAPRSPDEMLAVDLVLGQLPAEHRPDVIVSIVDASNLERNLYLTTQVLELGIPVVVALNMVDIAEGQGLKVDAERLARRLGVPVVPIQANRKLGLELLKEAVAQMPHTGALDGRAAPVFPSAFEEEAQSLASHLGGSVAPFLVRRLLLDTGGSAEERLLEGRPDLRDQVEEARARLEAAGCGVPAVEPRVRYAWIKERLAGCVVRPVRQVVTWTDRIDRLVTHRVWGTLIFAALMFVVFQALFAWAKPLMDLVNSGKDLLANLVGGALPTGPLTSLLTDGVIAGVGGVLVFLPQILILFGFIAILEDCGYMARVAFLMDRLMARAGLSGKSFIPMLSSMACAVPGIMATRVIENRRDRLATILVAPLMSCSARLPVYTLLIAAFFPIRGLNNPNGFAWWIPGLVLFCLYALGVIIAPVVAYVLKRTVLKGETPPFVMEMPLYKRPSPGTVLRRMAESGWEFVRRAGTIILASMIVVWALLYFPNGPAYSARIEEKKQALAALKEQAGATDAEKERLDRQAREQEAAINVEQGTWKRQSYLGRMGRAIEPVVRPLGWDWKVGMAALASFPAREVVVGTLGIIYNEGDVDPGEVSESANPAETGLSKALQGATWDDDPARRVFTVPVALSLMVFFALCCQCASTLAVIKRETNSWRWPVFTFAYMTALAYVGALVVYQAGSLIG
jgi:ferrous iron transport protein B